jgi:sugar O-acyltransferase (sialic acid O-acetyltransferase NeuD family)
MKTLYLCGVGNGEGIRLALTVNRNAARWQRIVLLDDDPGKHGTVRLGLEVAGPFSDLAALDATSAEVVNLVTRTAEGRANARRKIAQYGIPFTSLIHPDVDLLGTDIGEEVTLYPHASIGAEASVGASSVVLIGAVIGHGARVGEGCVIAPNAVVNARVVLGDRVYVGSNASILPDLTIGEGATIGANSLVYADVPAGATAVGVPAQILAVMPAPAFNGGGGPAVAVHAAASDPVVAADVDDRRADAEAVIARALQDVLGIAVIDRASNFFDLGCTSLKALELGRRLRGAFDKDLQGVEIYRYPSVQALATFLVGGDPSAGALRQAQQRAELRRHVRLRR